MQRFLPCLFAATTLGAQVASAQPMIKPIIDYRLRYENVDQAPLAEEAEALISRLRAGVEVGPFADTKLLAEGEWVAAIVDDYNSTTNGKTAFPIVADPEEVELNRLQISNTSIPGTTLTLGRQRINIDDQRFVGSVGWRANEQTFDAVRVETKPFKDLKLDLTYAIQANTIFGPDSAIGRLDGDNIFAVAAYSLPVGTFSLFFYDVEQDEVPARRIFSTRTVGARFTGKQPLGSSSLGYALAYARQSDAHMNPLDYRANYWLAETGLTYGGFSAGLGYERLGGNGVAAFQTPLATLHKFQGWADKFLTTPANGIEDLYARAAYAWKKVGPFDNIEAQAVYHRYDAAKGGIDYGDEVNLQLAAKVKKLVFTAKFADYNAEGFATDTRKFWLSVDYSY